LVLLAYCRNKKDWRKLYLSGIEGVEHTGETFRPWPERTWSCQVEDSFSIFQKETGEEVILCFNPFLARWIKE